MEYCLIYQHLLNLNKRTVAFLSLYFWAQFHNNLIRLNFNPKYFRQNYTFSQSSLLGMLKEECIVYLCMYINISCICKNNTHTI